MKKFFKRIGRHAQASQPDDDDLSEPQSEPQPGNADAGSSADNADAGPFADNVGAEPDSSDRSEAASRVIIDFDRRSFKKFLLITGICIAFAWLLNNFSFLGRVLATVLDWISPFIVGFCIAFIINTLLRPIESLWIKLFKKRKSRLLTRLKRPICLFLSTIIVFGAVFALFFMIIPELKTSIMSFANMLPQYLSNISEWWDGVVKFFEGHNIVLPEIEFNADEAGRFLNSLIQNNGSDFINTTVDITSIIISGLVDTVLAVVFSIYLLAQKEKIARQSRRVAFAVMPAKRAEKLIYIAQISHRTFSNFVTGQFTEALIIGVLCFIGMLIFGMPYAALISVLISFTALIPIFGAFFGTAIGAFLILLVDPVKAFWFIVFIIVLQQLESNLIYPKVVGSSVGLPGIWVLVAVTVGGGMFGIAGMLFSVPICSVLYCLFRQFISGRLRRKGIKM